MTEKRKGNPAWVKGVSGNPGGRKKFPEEFRQKCMSAVGEHVIDAWIDEVKIKFRQRFTDRGMYEYQGRGEHWVKCSELIAAYAYGKPAQSVELSGDPERPLVARELTDAELMAIAAEGVKHGSG